MAWYAGNNSTNGGNNTGWIFTAPPTPISYTLSGITGSYTYTGQSATLTVAKKLSGTTGSYTYTGQSATLTYTAGSSSTAYNLSGTTGSYTYTGQSATLTVIKVGWIEINTSQSYNPTIIPNTQVPVWGTTLNAQTQSWGANNNAQNPNWDIIQVNQNTTWSST